MRLLSLVLIAAFALVPAAAAGAESGDLPSRETPDRSDRGKIAPSAPTGESRIRVPQVVKSSS